MLDHRKMLSSEYNDNPNRSSSIVLIVIFVLLSIATLLNEFGIFHVPLVGERVCYLLSIPFFASSLALAFWRKSWSGTKYFILSSAWFVSFLVTLTMGAHTVIVMVTPLFIAIQYPNKKMVIIAIAMSCFSAFFSSIFNYSFGLWESDYYYFLATLGDVHAPEYVPSFEFSWESLGSIVLYQSLPRLLMIGGLCVLAFSASRLSQQNFENKKEILKLSETDVLTGVCNRFEYENSIREFSNRCKENFIAIFVDVNGLHSFNNKYGHDAGDLMLKGIATALKSQFGTRNVYRIGGDEFVVLYKDIEADEASKRMVAARDSARILGYEFAYGISVSPLPVDDPYEVVRDAEAKMTKDKADFYSVAGNDRRSHR